MVGVVGRSENEVKPLEERHHTARIGQMRPLVELVGQHRPPHQRAQEGGEEDVPGPISSGREPQRQAQDREADQAAVSVGIREVVAGNGQWIEVVLTEGRRKARPTTGRSGGPQVSAAQCTSPQTRSAVK